MSYIFFLNLWHASAIFIIKMRVIRAVYIISSILVLSTALAAEPLNSNDFILAKKSFEDGFYEIAARSFEKFISENPHDLGMLEAQLLLGESLVHLGRFNDATERIDAVINSEEAARFKDEAIYWKAEIYFRTRDYKKAKGLYNEILNDFASSRYAPYAEYSIARSLYEEKRYSEALDGFGLR